MSLFGAVMHPNVNQGLLMTWLSNIGKNVVVALPLQLLIAGPIVRRLFRKIISHRYGTRNSIEFIEGPLLRLNSEVAFYLNIFVK